MKINVVGTTGSGKSTLAHRISELTGAPVINMDELFWKSGWQQCSDEELFEKLTREIDRHDWVLDGNYTKTIPIKWKNVDTVVWLDIPFLINLWQLLKRSVARASTKTELWPGTGNYETFGRMFSRDSIILWLFSSYRKVRKNYIEAMKDPKYSRIEFVRLTNRKEIENFLERFRG